ncbi:hypothetical protein CMQ_7742 [Grosmannia clavigera kw1407]|uniref:Uncharacterized protein n=1 Tax=Grosmannia clavigera (strain kw1407 / UAMH 11150) TaxID=655863 RepID=F0XQ39_GROCL|nr:uncharacterized protein CMQ_7742 [Grosmannia clavigera kw1407]EFX00740.1 hypothetical protein CMQ_7742 [Grosmannia clavigera kw1407]
MSDEVFRRVGRGGAGNWYSKKDVEEAEKPEDRIEIPEQDTSSAAIRASPAPYARGGRGGAGNFFDSQSVAAVAVERQDEAVRLQAAASPSGYPRKPAAYSGRGGAGNWTGAIAAAEQEQEAKERQKQQQQAVMEAQIRQDVEAGLAMPAPAYHAKPARDGQKTPAGGL